MKPMTFFVDWHFMRWLRLILGTFLLYQGYTISDNFSLFVGVFLLIQVITNTGCCGAGGCNIPSKRDSKQEDDIVDYTIIKP